MKCAHKPLLLAIALLPAAVLAAGGSHPYYAITTQTVDSVESEITWYFDTTTYEAAQGSQVTALKLAEIDGTLIESRPTLPTVFKVGGKVLPVIEYGDSAFAGQTVVKEIAVPDSIKRIGNRTFMGCLSLNSVSFGAAVTEIGDEVFYDCDSLASVTFNEGLRYIGRHPFVNTAIKEITLPDTLLDMYGNIAAGTLYGTSITISDSSHFAYSDDGYCLYNKDKTRLYCCQPRAEGSVTLPATLTEIMPDAFFGCFRLTYLNVPANVTTIGSKAFNVSGIWPDVPALESKPKLETVFYQGATNIANAADDIYDGTPTTLTSYAFSEQWTGSEWKGRPLKVAKDAYSPILSTDVDGLEWKFQIVNNSYAEIYNSGEAAIPTGTADGTIVEGSDTKGVQIPLSLYGYPVNRIGNGAFKNCNVIKTLFLPATVSEIGDYAFANCTALKSICSSEDVAFPPDGVNLPEGVEKIGYRAFEGANKLQSLSIPATLSSVTNNPIAGCKNINSIEVASANGYFAFADGILYNADKSRLIACLSTQSDISLLTTVKEIGDDAFADSTILATVTALCEVPKASDDIFANTPASLVVKAETTSLPTWKAFVGTTWKGRAFIDLSDSEAGTKYVDASGTEWHYVITNGVAVITSVRTADDSAMLALTLPTSIGKYVVKAIGPAALANLHGITAITLPSTYEAIGDRAFSNCTSLAAVTLPSGLRALGKAPFAGTAITALSLPNTVTSLDGNPLAGCAFLTSVSVDAGNAAFAAADGLLFDATGARLIACVPLATAATLPETLAEIAPDAFAGCSRLLAVSALCEVPAADDAVFADTPAQLIVAADAWELTTWQNYIGKKWKNRTFANTGVQDSDTPQTYADGQGNSWKFTLSSGTATIVGMGAAPTGAIAIPATVTVSGSSKTINVTAVGPNAFANCSAITQMTIPASVARLTGEAFVGCTALEAFSVEAASERFKAKNGVLYSKDGKTLVKVPAGFRFKTTITSKETTVNQTVIEVVNGFDSNLNPIPNTVIVTDESAPATSTCDYAFTPAVSAAMLMSGVTFVADYAFSDCGYLPTGSVANGTLVTKQDGKVISSESGFVTIACGTDATNETYQTFTVTKSGFYNKQVANWGTLENCDVKTSHNVSKPDVGSAVCVPKAWVNSIWTTESANPSKSDDDDDGDDDDDNAPLQDGTRVSVASGVSQSIRTGIDSTTAKSVRASGLPSGLKLVKTTDKATGVTTWSIQGVPTKAAQKTVTLTVTKQDGTKSKISFALATGAIPAWLTGAFNGVVYDAQARAVGAATASISTSGKLSGKLQVPSADGTKAMSYSLAMKGFSSYDAETACYRGTATVKIGKTTRDADVACMKAADGTGALMLDLGEDGAVDLVQNIWKRKDLTPPAYAKNSSVTLDGFTFKFQSAGKVKWSGVLRGDNGKDVKVSGTTQLLNDASTILLYVPPRRNLSGGLAAVVNLASAD